MPLRVTGGPSRISMTDAEKRPLLQRVCASPRVYVADGFATAAEVTHVIERAERLERHPPSGLEATRGVAGFAFEMPVAGDTVLSQLCDAIYIALGFGNVCGDTVRFRRYERGNSHPAHCDVYEIAGAHLVATAIVYLNDADGGATFFAVAEGGALSIDPQLGRLAVWLQPHVGQRRGVAHGSMSGVRRMRRVALLPDSAHATSVLPATVIRCDVSTTIHLP